MKSSRAGFTLVEILLTLGVLAIGLTSIFTLLPGVTDFSRNLRDQDRMRTFADSVFASVEWSLQRSEIPETVSGEEKRSFPNLLGVQEVKISDEEQSWPDTDGVEDLVPVFFYRLQVVTNDVSEVEARLQLRPQSRTNIVEFTRVLSPQVKAW